MAGSHLSPRYGDRQVAMFLSGTFIPNAINDQSNKRSEMKTARFEGRVIDGAQGVDIKEAHGGKPDFRCVECGSAARVERAGGHMPDRFEHLERNDHCSLVSKRPR